MTAAVSSTVPPPAVEASRLAALRGLRVLDAAPEPVFDLLAAQAALACGVPVALISLVDERRHWFFARHGLDMTEIPRNDSFCSHAILHGELFEVVDAADDPRFARNPFVVGAPGIRFYAAAPILLAGGEAIGTLCAIAPHAHRLDAAQRAQLSNMARLVATLLEERRERLVLASDLGTSDARYQAMVEEQTDLVALVEPDGRISWANQALGDVVAERSDLLAGRPLLDFVVDADRVALRGQLRLARERGTAVVGEARMLSPAGDEHWIEWKHRAIGPGLDQKIANGLAVQSVGRDITQRKLLERDLLHSEQRYRSLFDHMRSGFALHEVVRDAAGVVVDIVFLAVNAAHASFLGFEIEQVYGARLSELYPGLNTEMREWLDFFTPVAMEGQTLAFERHSPRSDRWYSIVAYRPAPGQYATITEDITERRQAQEEVQAQHEQLRVTLHSIGDAVITTDNAGRVQYLNPVAERLTGWSDEEARGHALEDVYRTVDEVSLQPLPNPVLPCLGGRTIAAAPSIGSGRDAPLATLGSRHGTEAGVEQTVAPICAADGRVLGAVLVFRDVTERRRMAREMSYRATHDALTGLINRTDFESRLHQTLRLAHADGSEHVLMYIDLDQFKLVNDACGHAAGDQLLRQVATLAKQCLRARDTLARLGGDEFGVILQGCDTERGRIVAQQICDRMDEYRFAHGDRRFRIGASIGLVPLDGRWPTAATVMQAADAACYAAKEAGRNRVHPWVDADPGLMLRHGEMQWVARLEQAIDEDLFELFAQRIQPIRAPAGGLHCEVLLRLREADGRLVPPGAFLPAAERFHMATRIDQWVVRAVVAWMARRRDELAHVGTIAVNLSGQSISDPCFLRQIAEIVEGSRFEASKLCFEVTETAAITNMADATAFVDAMRGHGIRFALDDFGAGASGFSYLKTLQVDYLKIDGQFIRDLRTDPIDRATVRCFRDVAAAVGMQTIAEFVENEETAALLREIGIDYAQGYLYHRPEPIDDVVGVAVPAA